MMTPYHVAPPSRLLGKRPTRPVRASSTAFGCSRASFIHPPVNSRLSSFLTCSGLSRSRNHISSSTRLPSPSSHVQMWVIGALCTTGPNLFSGNQSSQVRSVVVVNSPYVLRVATQRERLMPSGPGACSMARVHISQHMPTDLPEPTGPL